jgi:hypothetical protein
MDPNNYFGQIYAYNVTNGNLLWIYNATAAPYYYESAYGNNMPLMLGAVCDQKVYVYSYEHSPTNPLWRQAYMRCININDGTLIWKLEDFSWGGPAIADGCLISCNQYDNLIYCIGKGPSATTVDAPNTGVSMGTTFLITGTVTDQSPGALAHAQKYGNINGVACVSEAIQEAWMEYIYEQQPMPTNTIGVPVSIHAIDPNGNDVLLGTATSDVNGFYSLAVDTNQLGAGSGTYGVIATFAGSNSYGASTAESAFNINSSPTLAPTTAPLTTSNSTQTIIEAGIVAIIVVIIVGFTILAVMLRKRLH